MRTVEAILAASTDAIVTVGEGRGFLVALPPWPPMVITAAHCLPFLPPANPAAFGDERTYADLVGPIETAPTMTAECLFVDPIADVAVLGCPDHHARHRDATAYEAFVALRPTLRMGALRRTCPSWLLTLGGHWEPCHAQAGGAHGNARRPDRWRRTGDLRIADRDDRRVRRRRRHRAGRGQHGSDVERGPTLTTAARGDVTALVAARVPRNNEDSTDGTPAGANPTSLIRSPDHTRLTRTSIARQVDHARS